MLPVSELTCRELVELVTEYLEGVLPAGERTRFEAHLADCPGCRNYLQQMRRTIDTLGRLSEDSLPEEAKQKLLAAFRSWKAG
ncbi:MAG TPA: zf-HC2 domain-containing protein [Chloroflexota bacterium]|jgi:anti-sigma factor RsiW|nr:zf-HC2 domain-containing protein [Chloroflexota bacterium]